MDDATLLRFLRARKFDVPKAKFMIVAAEQWRKDFGVDDIVQYVPASPARAPMTLSQLQSERRTPNAESPRLPAGTLIFYEREGVDKYYPQYYHKMDKEGRPLYIQKLGLIDVKALYQITTTERQLQRLVLEYEKFITERLPACSAAIGHPVETSCTILDLYNVSISNFYRVKDYVSAASSIGQDRYPETMGKFYIINAPWAFSAVWTIIKPWLDEATVAKIDIIGSSYKDKLLEQIPRENLPKEFGGLCQCEGGCSLSDAGPWNADAKAVAVAETETA
ncbi:hypothetical protein EVG20_g6749 [Dentipellis fragilis]|uniref:CRAL-TRIO domain-containing protein n=1 Tax=Dentipellis fragilis TaxID=205917 RepID=A0A4Y9YL43_9AGAM|nr:hypothetical protein EVG20_g6749 [Dentipellis fragilis]